MKTKLRYTIQCTHPETGKTGSWAFIGEDHRKPGTSVTPVFDDLQKFYDFIKRVGWESQDNFIEVDIRPPMCGEWFLGCRFNIVRAMFDFDCQSFPICNSPF